MLKGNLATRPFYNERLVTAALALVALLVLVVSVFNVRALLALTRERAGLQTAISKDQMQADQFHTQARSLQQTVDREDLRTLAAETREANGLIDQRTFSWTTLLSVLEKKLPIDVRLIGIFPKIDHDYVEVTMTLTARRESDVQAFIAKLEEDGVFYDVLQREAQRNDDGTYDATVEAFYLEPGSVTTPKTPTAPAPVKPGERPRRPMTLWRRIFSERRPVVIPLAILVAANVAVFALAVLPLEESVRSYRDQAVDTKGLLAQAQLDVSVAKKARASKQQADEELKKFYQEILPTSFSAARDEADFGLDRIAREAGVIKKNQHFEPEPVKDSRLYRLKGKVIVDGDYESIRRFLYAAETAHEFVVIEQVELAQSGVSGAPSSTIEVTVSLATYYYATTEASAR